MAEDAHGTESVDGIAPRAPFPWRIAKVLTLFAFLFVVGIVGAVAGLFALDEKSMQAVVFIATIPATLTWFELDARERRRPLRWWERIGLILAPPLFAAIVFCRSRGWKAVLPIVLLLVYMVFVGACLAVTIPLGAGLQ